MQTEFLEHIGLTKGEARIYLSLLALGQTTTGPIIAEAEISSSKVYEILEKLMQKGLVSSTTRNKTKYYQATSPKKLMRYLEKREQQVKEQKIELSQLLPDLIKMQKGKRQAYNVEIFTGLTGVKEMFWELVEDAEKGEDFLFFGGIGEGYVTAIKKFYFKYDIYRHEKGLRVRGIALNKLRHFYSKGWHARMRYVDFPTPSNIGIYRNKVAIASWTNEPIGILITSSDIADKFRHFFENAWKNATH